MGYRHIRSSYQMLIEMDAPVPEPVWPEGITLRTYNPETDAEAVYRAENESFRDHSGLWKSHSKKASNDSDTFMIDHEGFDPTLCSSPWMATRSPVSISAALIPMMIRTWAG